MHLVGTFIIGLVAGLAAARLAGARRPGAWLLAGVLGIAGALAGSYLGLFTGLITHAPEEGYLGAMVGAVVLLGIHHLVVRE